MGMWEMRDPIFDRRGGFVLLLIFDLLLDRCQFLGHIATRPFFLHIQDRAKREIEDGSRDVYVRTW